MFYLVFSCAFVLIFASGCKEDGPTAPTFEQRNEGVFPGVGAARVRLGDSFAQIRSVHGEPEARGGYPYYSGDSTKYEIYWITYTAKGIKVYMKDVVIASGLRDTDISEEVVVMAPYNVRTDRGIGIGSSTTQLTTAYGQPSGITAIGSSTYYEYQSLGIDFVFQSSAVVRMACHAPR
jgi:hypothetical protein